MSRMGPRWAALLLSGCLLSPAPAAGVQVGPRLDLLAKREICHPPWVGVLPPLPAPEVWQVCGGQG